MGANPEGVFERAMTHVPDSVDGLRTCPRPAAILAIASRMQAWRDAPEVCQCCHAANARSIVMGVAFCALCRDRRQASEGGLEILDRTLRSQPTTGDGFSGHAIVFDSLSVDLGGFRERIRPTAVNRTLSENGDVRALWNHNSDYHLGRTAANTLGLRKDAVGLETTIIPPAWASGYLETVDRGDVSGMSFGFRAIEDEWYFDGPIPIRDVVDMKISEISIVGWPAYPSTDISVSRNLRLVRSTRLEMLERWHKTRIAR